MTIITLTTDFGLADGYVGILKGVILTIAPDARLVDISHEVTPQDVRQAAYILARSTPYFPAGTVHLVVVDPGVGGTRRPLAVRTPAAFFVGPDNGVFTDALGLPAAQAFQLDEPRFWQPEVSQTFHGRDIFAPVAAHLASGHPLERMGRPIADPVRLSLPAAVRQADGRIVGQVIYVDHFGNLITNIPGAWIGASRWQCRIADRQIDGLSRSYAEVSRGTLVALVSSGGTLEIAVRDGSATRQLGVSPGEPVNLRPQGPT